MLALIHTDTQTSGHAALETLINSVSNILVWFQAEIMIKVCSEIVAELIQAHDAGKDINLNGLKQRYSRKHKAQNQPKLVDIIAAIPEQYKAVLLPNLKAKPVRTASGVSHCTAAHGS